MPFLKTERGGLVNTSHVTAIIECEDDSAFAISPLGLDCIEIDDSLYAGYRLLHNYSTVQVILTGSLE